MGTTTAAECTPAERLHLSLFAGQLLLPTPDEYLAMVKPFGPEYRAACLALIERWAALEADAKALVAQGVQ